jgi:hypothetical protein
MAASALTCAVAAREMEVAAITPIALNAEGHSDG